MRHLLLYMYCTNIIKRFFNILLILLLVHQPLWCNVMYCIVVFRWKRRVAILKWEMRD